MGYPKLTPITATGATAPRYLGDRFADIVNVKDFGAVGDGVADDTAAFTAAQNSGAQAVMVPNGTYKITEDVAGTFFSFGEIATTGGGDVEIIDILSLDSIPTGTVLWLSTPSVPAGYLLCNGSAVSRTAYPELFTAIGTTYGTGDGSTTFNLPNLIDKFAEGSAVAGTVKSAGLPNLTGDTTFYSFGNEGSGTWAGCLKTNTMNDSAGTFVNGNLAKYNKVELDASHGSTIYGNSDTVQPPALTLLPCIKAFSSVVGDAAVVAGQLVNDIQSKVALDGSNISSIGPTLAEYMAHAAMPSERYIDLSVPQDKSIISSPGDGFMFLSATATNNNYGYVQLSSRSVGNKTTSYGRVSIFTSIPVSKNADVLVGYNVNMTNIELMFVYANCAV